METTDEQSLAKIKRMADAITKQVGDEKDPEIFIPTRHLDNVHYNRTTKMLELGTKKNRRVLFDLHQAKSFMQSLLVAKGSRNLINQGKTVSIRGLYYMLKHTISNSREETFAEQTECDGIIEDMEVALNVMREDMHLYASNRGNIAGEIKIQDGKSLIDCSRMGSGGYSIPSICEPGVIQFISHNAKFILHVEKDTVWRRFNEDEFWNKHNCLLTHGGGQPSRGVRRLLYRLHHELSLPVYCLLDNDPYGYYIYSVIKQGSINLAHESRRMAIPEAKYIGLRSNDYERCKLSKSTKIEITDTDIRRAKQIAKYPWFKNKVPWQREIQMMLNNGFKLEVESLISKSISYVTETYVPERLAEREWLD